MEKLIILPELCYNKDEEWKSKIGKIYDTLDKNKIDLSWWYLDGDLESIVQYDKGIAINYVELGYYKEQPDWCEIRGFKVTELRSDKTKYKMYYNGIIECEVVGVNEPCIGYFWTTDESTITNLDGTTFPYWTQRGLVCLKTDEEACKRALKKYTEKTTIL